MKGMIIAGGKPMDSQPYVDIPIKMAPEELASARPGDRIEIAAVLKVTSITEDTVCGELHDIGIGGEAPVEEEEADVEPIDEEEDEEEEVTPPPTATPKY